MYGYIYKTTNTDTGLIYIGQHKSAVFDKDYYGSGTILSQSLQKHGKERFIREIIDTCESPEELNKREAYWIEFFHARDRAVGYNIKPGGNGASLAEETKRKISESNRGKKRSPQYIEKMRKRQLGNKNNGGRNKGRVILHRGDTNIFVLPEEISDYLRWGYLKGPKPITPEKAEAYRQKYQNRIYINKDGKNKYVYQE